MTAINSQYKKRYLNYAIGVSLYALIFALLSIVFGDGFFFTKTGLVFFFEDFFVPGSVVVANYFLDKYLTDFGLKSKIGKRVFIKILASISVVFVATIITNELELWIGFIDDDTISLGAFQIDAYWTNVVDSILVVLIIGIPAFYREGQIDEKRELLEEQQLKVQYLSKELGVLKLQLYSANVKPHFIFNTLNSVLSLIYESPEKAEELVIHLSDFLRQSLYSSNVSEHTLGEELEAISNYLKIEKIRFGDSVRYSFENGDDLNEQKIPKFFLLPLVENALKHNRETMDLKIVVRTYMDNQYLVTEVWDSGKPFPEDMNWNSGLRGTDSMLQAYFGKEYTFSFHQSPQKMVQVKIKIDAKDI
jgi:hypothetical protein